MTLKQIALPQPPNGLRFEVPRVANALFEVKAEAAGTVISIFAAIGDEVKAARVSEALRQAGRGRPVTVRINSQGGDFFEGAAIYNLLRAHQGPVITQVLGIAASAASLIAMAGERIEIARNAQIMIHQAWTVAIGNRELMEKASGFLVKVDQALAETYSARTGLPVPQVLELMRAETFFSAKEALDSRFADRLLDRDALAAPKNTPMPRNQHELEADLRRIGFARAAATRIAAGGWPALAGVDPEAVEIRALTARVRRATSEIESKRTP